MTYDQIRSKIYLLTKTNVNSLSNANLILFTQPAEDRVNSILLRCDSRWEFDDSNSSDLPIATTALVSGQQDYSLATTHLTIDRVEVKDSNGNWTLLKPVDQHDVQYQALGQYLKTNGLPIEYDKLGNSIFLYPIPNYSQTSSLKIYYTREMLKFDYTTSHFTDGTGSVSSTPGFNSLFHDLIALWASYDYCIANSLQNASNILGEITRKETELDTFYGLRSHDERPRMGVSTSTNYSGTQSGIIGRWGADSTR